MAAVDEYKKAVELDRDNVIKRFNLGLAYYKEQMYDQAIATFKEMLDLNKSDIEYRVRRNF
jgi:cytochrome c-type biogenesis protein CcmH/NrfG